MLEENKNIPFLSYQEVLSKIQNQENHLLIANGFNYGLGVHTGYSDIFKKMLDSNFGIYNEAKKYIEECHYDLESFLKRMTDDISKDNVFLKKYICNKIKMDFMKALHEIVKSQIKNIYEEKNEGIYILLKEFTNYFTLNYDAFLYMLLLKYKTTDSDNNALAFEPTLNFIEEDLDERQNNIYTEIKDARDKGELGITIENNITKKEMRFLTKSQFVSTISTYNKDRKKNWKTKDINEVVNRIWKEEKRNLVIKHVDDGSRQLSLFGDDFIFDINSQTQNLFFLHGAFHIYRAGKFIKKITQTTDKALYDRLEELLNSENKDIVCIFESTGKLDLIQKNSYLKHCYEKLGTLSGNMVIIGSSLADNDNHIFSKIDKSQIEKVYISSLPKELDRNYKLAKEKFPNTDVYLFDADTISYEKPEE